VFTNLFTLLSRRQGRTTKEKQMLEMDEFHSTVLEGYWWGLNACEIAHDMGADPVIVARIIDDFETLGY
jgi:hypothetical protein